MSGEEEKPKLNIIKLSKMPLRLIMEKDFLRLSPDDKIETLIKGLEHRTCAVITDENGKLLGFVSIDEVVNLIVPPSDYILVGIDAIKEAHFDWERPVKEIMNPRPITLSPSDRLGYALEVMLETGVKQFPVVDRGRKVVGTFSAQSIVRLLRVFAR
ncbi:CBS domain-containing protein [Thermococcus peptonophilus]|uniref:CBS domain-containing protein n=1 Tax=Thermococcus peptonophilus TaxID=53952 RepID=A0A142CUV8_9EURY|nr:CBS domain-containing protein [Thermococcus peptonophilus]AMQ18560.1 CBS domain-containing protein [Thermococcus peptonophilus]